MCANTWGLQGQKLTASGIIIMAFWSLILIAMIAEIVIWSMGILPTSTLYVLVAITLLAFVVSIVIVRIAMAKKIRSSEDERLRKLDAFARGNAWAVSMLLMTVLFILMEFKILELNGFLVVFIIYLVMGWSWILFRAYYYLKGDVE